MSFSELFQGTSKERFVAVKLLNVTLFKFIDPEKKKALHPVGKILDISGKEFYELHITTERPKFEKGEHVLALKPHESGFRKYQFFPAVVQSSCISEDKRKMYELQFDDGTKEKVHEEFVIPTIDKWNSKENEPKPKETTPESEKESKNEHESKDEKEKESESESSSEKEKRKHKRKHHHHKKHNKKEKQGPQIIMIPIFVPMMPFMM